MLPDVRAERWPVMEPAAMKSHHSVGRCLKNMFMRKGDVSLMPGIMPNSIADVVYQKVKGRIVSGKLRLGQRITDTEFVEEFKVSKTPIREAFLKLKDEGLIVIVPRSGTFIFTFSEQDLRSLCEARIVFEEGALRKAYADNSIKLASELSQSVKAQQQLIESGSCFRKYLKMDREFHCIFFESAANPYLTKAHALLFDKINVLRTYLDLTPGFMEHSVGSHQAILDYTMQDDIDSACNRLRKHIMGTFNDDFLAHLNSLQAG
jgi:DNA-binding GntR family transcriptional regulator